jgi:hypothetical protein
MEMKKIGSWISKRIERKREAKRVLALENIRVTAAYLEADLSDFSDEWLERTILTRFSSLVDCSNNLDVFMSVYTKMLLVHHALRRYKTEKSKGKED